MDLGFADEEATELVFRFVHKFRADMEEDVPGRAGELEGISVGIRLHPMSDLRKLPVEINRADGIDGGVAVVGGEEEGEIVLGF